MGAANILLVLRTHLFSHWQQMGGVSIQVDMIIDKSIRRSVNSRASVLKRYVADIGKSWPVLIRYPGPTEVV
ncbi:hypothetical protein Bca52824_019327 [Brassica carinata]|uniref:Uncharacterized protein n=1 Tax=Brassica carinata TaxID=52824 RepID=A0A8X7VRU6_BRACI|nr:hypothetical protein Bca52824_019327 [Brassica carinata]